jgi:hypothetical protein
MLARVLLGLFAALRAVLIPGQVEVMTAAPLQWPSLERFLTRQSAPAANVSQRFAAPVR